MEQIFLKRSINGQQIYDKCPTSFVIREMQSKTTLRFHLTPIRITIKSHLDGLGRINASEDVGEVETFYTVGGNVN